jgi:hypothetical protein
MLNGRIAVMLSQAPSTIANKASVSKPPEWLAI